MHRLFKLLCLDQSILARGGIQNEQHLVRRGMNALFADAIHFFQLAHQVELGVQPTSRVNNKQIVATGAGGTDAIVGYRARIAVGLPGNDRHIGSFTPNLELIDSRSAKGVGSGQNDLAPLVQVMLGQLADGGRFAGTIDAHNHHYCKLTCCF